MTRRSTTEARERIAEALKDFQALQRFRQEEEQDRLDAEEADRILSEAKPEDFVPWEKVTTDLKL